MGLTLAERRAVIEATAIRNSQADKRTKGVILDELCATTGWHRNHARKALTSALQPKLVAPRSPRPPRYGPDVIAALTVCWVVPGMPAGKRLAPMLGELVMVLRHFGELVIDDTTAALLVSMSAATIDRRLAPERRRHRLKGRVATKPGSLLKSQIPVRTWADWDDARPGFVEIDLVAHAGGNATGPYAYTLTVTDIATGWTENRSVPDKTAKCVLAALNDIAYKIRSRSWAWTLTTDLNSSTSTCCDGAPGARSPSPARGRPIKTTAVTSSRRTGRWSAPWSATTATTPPQKCCDSTRSGSCSPS
jgi:hypothetical protein